MCLGLNPEGAEGLTASEVGRIEAKASALHRRSHLTTPSAWTLAPLASVRIASIRRGLPVEGGGVFYHAKAAVFVRGDDERDDALGAAFALASAIVLQRGLPWSEVFRWRLAAELLVPGWALADRGADPSVATLPMAPAWLIEQARSRWLADVANK